ncbi:MAG: hypothetical protein DI602_08600 [Aliarcobacter butzleri]|nr:MAG: hypothetical protein DI602_08600 [Aliarcobacter butzleri]
MEDELYQALIEKGLALDIQAVRTCNGNQDCVIGLLKDFYNNLNDTSKSNFLNTINECLLPISDQNLPISDEDLAISDEDLEEISSFDR